METSIISTSPAQSVPPPTLRADVRPTADAAAITRNTIPHVPLPIPASTTQKGAVAEAQIKPDTTAIAGVGRVLKPYGVVMLPQGPQSAASGSNAEHTKADQADSSESDAKAAFGDKLQKGWELPAAVA